MSGGAKFLACTAVLAMAACTNNGTLEIRPTASKLAQGNKPVPFRIAEGHQQFALGNVALALESYRKAWREDANSVDALAGIAACYDRMGRFDLARRSYEAALAIEPHNTTVLAMLAASFEQQGKRAEASRVRAEIEKRLATAEAPAILANEPAEVAVVEAALPAPDLSAALPAIASAPIAISLGTIAPATAVAAFAPDEPAELAAPAPARPIKPVALAEATAPAQSVTITLPAARPASPAKPTVEKVEAASSPPSIAVMAAAERPAPAKAPEVPQPSVPLATAVAQATAPARPARPATTIPVATGIGPRLERTSLGEVALVTTREPQWASLVVKQDQRSATVRFVPLRQASARFASVRLLNAARVQGLAARTRSTLFDRGWRGMAIGDASSIRASSVVLYPAHRRRTALSLARQFGFEAAQRSGSREITVLLGRDAARLVRRPPDA